MTQTATRRCMRATLHPGDPSRPAGLRRVRPDDVDALAALMLDAYRGTADDAGESLDDARLEVAKTFAGAYGSFDADCSCVLVQHGLALSATLVTHWRGRPLIAFTFTRAGFKRRGLARQCMTAAMTALQAAGEDEVDLVVTLANAPAVALYRSLGFQDVAVG